MGGQPPWVDVPCWDSEVKTMSYGAWAVKCTRCTPWLARRWLRSAADVLVEIILLLGSCRRFPWYGGDCSALQYFLGCENFGLQDWDGSYTSLPWPLYKQTNNSTNKNIRWDQTGPGTSTAYHVCSPFIPMRVPQISCFAMFDVVDLGSPNMVVFFSRIR